MLAKASLPDLLPLLSDTGGPRDAGAEGQTCCAGAPPCLLGSPQRVPPKKAALRPLGAGRVPLVGVPTPAGGDTFMIAIESTSTEPQIAALPLASAAPPQSPYERWADIFVRAHDDTHSIALALEALDAIRSFENIGTRPAVDDSGRILAIAASLFSVPVKRLRERNRHRDVTDARYVAAFLLRRRDWTTEKTGALFGLDHSTIVSGLQKVENTPRLLVAVAKAEHLLGPVSITVAK